MEFLDLIKSDGYITVSKELAREIGLNETIVLSELISQYEYFKNNNQLKDQEWFYCTIEKLKKQTTLSKDQQSKAIKSLERNNLIIKELKGLPARRHFKINKKQIKQLFLEEKTDNPRNDQIEEKSQTGLRESRKQDSEKVANINKNYNNNNNNNKIEEEEARKISDKFKQVYNQKLSVQLFQKLTNIYSDSKILLKALEVAEEKGDKPAYLIKILSDWKKNKLNTVNDVVEYLKQRKVKNSKSGSYKGNKRAKELHNIESLEKKGWNK